MKRFSMFAFFALAPFFAEAQTSIPTGSSASTYTANSGNYILSGNLTYTGTAANGAILLSPGSALQIGPNSVLSSTDTSGGARAIRLTNNAGNFSITVGSNSTVQAQSNDGIKQQNNGSLITLTNNGTIRTFKSTTFNASVGQALDFDGNTGVSTITNNVGALIQADGADAIRVGSNMSIFNYGTIKGNSNVNDNAANNNSSYNFANTFDTSEAVDFRSAANASLTNNGTIIGTRHGVDGDTAATNITINNLSGGSIIGQNGSGIGSDATNISASNYLVNNYGLIRGDYAGVGNIFDRSGAASIDGDGDGVDIDGGATINNFTGASILATGAAGYDSGGRANGSDGISIGGGIINNSGLIQGANNGIIVNNDSVASRSGVAATTITNNSTGTIAGLNGFAIRLENKLGDARDNDTIINYGTITANGTIPTPTGVVTRQYGETDANSVGTLDGVAYSGNGSARFIRGDGAAIQTGEGNDAITNYGTITGNSGRAISMEGGNDTLTVSGGSAVINGAVNGGTGSDTLNFSPGAGNTFNATSAFSNFEQININAGKTILNTSLTANGTGNGAVNIKNGGNLNLASTNNSTVIVESGGQLTGTGSVGALTLQSGALLAPGNSPGTITADSVIWDGGADFVFELGATSDQLVILGALTKGSAGTYEIILTAGEGLSEGLKDLITFNSTNFNGSDFTIINNTPGLIGNLVLNGSTLSYNVTTVPEPSTALLVVLGLGVLAAGRRRAV
ncbi:MAG: PEP-CTERM sorting domain-containing protein [Candidatus Methylacidiphilales bacterium]|nr:PEP-CTERM sorting domain-containing protein [Candidatus Methylacidiphilales bacterium]